MSKIEMKLRVVVYIGRLSKLIVHGFPLSTAFTMQMNVTMSEDNQIALSAAYFALGGTIAKITNRAKLL